MKIAAHRYFEAGLRPHLPADVEVAWYHDADTGVTAVRGAPAAMIDLFFDPPGVRRMVEAGGVELRWVQSILSGIEGHPVDLYAERGILFTNGAGVNAVPVAEFAVLGVYALAKGLHGIIGAQGRGLWSERPFGTTEVAGSAVLVVGAGPIGREVNRQLSGAGARVSMVRRRADPAKGELGPNDWRARLPEFDFVVLAAPATPETRGMIGRAELAACKPGAGLVNVGRGSLVDQDALMEAAAAGRVTAFLDTVEPEPLPPEHPLWRTSGVTITSHLSGRSQTRMPDRIGALFAENLRRFRAGERLANLVDPALGYAPPVD